MISYVLQGLASNLTPIFLVVVWFRLSAAAEQRKEKPNEVAVVISLSIQLIAALCWWVGIIVSYAT